MDEKTKAYYAAAEAVEQNEDETLILDTIKKLDAFGDNGLSGVLRHMLQEIRPELLEKLPELPPTDPDYEE